MYIRIWNYQSSENKPTSLLSILRSYPLYLLSLISIVGCELREYADKGVGAASCFSPKINQKHFATVHVILAMAEALELHEIS